MCKFSSPLDTIFDSAMASHFEWDLWSDIMEGVASWFGQELNRCKAEYLRRRSFNPLHEALLAHCNNALLLSLDKAQHNGTLRSLLDETDAQGRSVLTWAVEYHDTEAVDMLLAYGADANSLRDSPGGSLPLLHLALAAKEVPQSLVKSLLLAGADVNARDHEGWTAAHIAASWGDHATLDTLEQYSIQSVDLDAWTGAGQTVQDLLACGDGGLM